MLAVDTGGRHIAVCCQHLDQSIHFTMISPAGHRLGEDIVGEGTAGEGTAGEGIAEVVLHRSIVGSTSWRSDDSYDCQWCSIWGDCVVNRMRGMELSD